MAIFLKSLNMGITASAMCSADYKERFAAEYLQTKVRYERLKAFCDKIEAAFITAAAVDSPKKIKESAHDCPMRLLRDQQRLMGEYLHTLEMRAIIEDIDLEEYVSGMLNEWEAEESLDRAVK